MFHIITVPLELTLKLYIIKLKLRKRRAFCILLLKYLSNLNVCSLKPSPEQALAFSKCRITVHGAVLRVINDIKRSFFSLSKTKNTREQKCKDWINQLLAHPANWLTTYSGNVISKTTKHTLLTNYTIVCGMTGYLKVLLTTSTSTV